MNQPQDFTAQRSKALWYAELELGFKYDGQRTIMNHRKHYGPVRVQKMLWPEKTGVCHAIIVHPPAGRGDHLTFQISTQENAHAVVTTPGAGKWYKTNGKQAFQHIHLQVKDIRFWNGFLKKPCYLMVPMPIQKPVFIWIKLRVLLVGICWYWSTSSAETFQSGAYANQFKLYREQKLLVADTLRFKGQDRWLSSCLGMNGYAVMGSFWAVAPEQYRAGFYLEQQIELIRELMVRMKVPVRLTLLDDVICARFLGDDVRVCHDAFAAIRARLRRYWFNLDEEFPRIWRT
jgi:urease accessory protein